MGVLRYCWCALMLGVTVLRIVENIESAPERSLVTHLPGFTGNFPSKHYSGYVTIEDQKHLFYYFVVSERNPFEDAVVLWLNGGPGCSSFDGFVYEHGPFIFELGKKNGSLPTLHLNPFSWSKVSNIIYLDSPAGVGLSFAQSSSAYSTDDLQTAADTHSFLLEWFELYPEFVNNPFYIAGESFAGIYVPTLASRVVQGIKAGAKPTINLKGYIVGNGVTDENFDGNALVPFAHGMGLISDDIYENVKSACQEKYLSYQEDAVGEGCESALSEVYKAIAGLNVYDILEPCFHDPTSASKVEDRLPISFKQLGHTNKKFPVRKRMYGRAWPLLAPVRDGPVPLWPQLAQSIPCVDDRIASIWLNDESVRKAVRAESRNVAGPWELCTERISYDHNAGSMIPYHKNLTAQGYRALVYSGDHDMCVPFTGSEAWTRSLGYKVINSWRKWMTDDGRQVAGYVQDYYHNLTFLTVKGAGHAVPEYKPQESLSFYSRWLDQLPI